MGEKFAANPVSGTGATTVPLAVSPGRSGFTPSLTLSYDSGSGNGPFGFGWELSLPSVTRKTSKGIPLYRDEIDSDVFELSGMEDLVPVLRQDAAGDWVIGPSGARRVHEEVEEGHVVRRYRPRIEGLFARIERWSRIDDPADIHWRSITRNNVLTIYGAGPEERIHDPADPRRIFSWLISETRDDKGNAILYRYKAEDGAGVDLAHPAERNRGAADDPGRTANRYLKRVFYGNRVPLLDPAGRRPRFIDRAEVDARIADRGWMFEVVFDYGDHDRDFPLPAPDRAWTYRKDPFSSWKSGFEVRTTRLCRRALMFHHFPGRAGVGADCLVRSTDLAYSDESDPAGPAGQYYTFIRSITQSGYVRGAGGYERASLPPLEFDYSLPEIGESVEELDPHSVADLPVGLDGSDYRWVDLDGDGIPGILTEQGGAWFFKRNVSPAPLPAASSSAQFLPMRRLPERPSAALSAGAEILDLAGDGRADLVLLEGDVQGMYERDESDSWSDFRPFRSRLNRSFANPDLRLIDLNGDGRADILITEDNAFVRHDSLGAEGFGPARRVAQALDDERGPRLVFGDPEQSIHLADLSGDGLTDLVRIRQNEVCYWPNLGHGRFGPKVTMADSPAFDEHGRFDPDRIRLADIDGSGTTDIIYLHREGPRLYFNQSGNGWSEACRLAGFPAIDNSRSIAAVDLLGTGTACLVWSSPLPGGCQMRFVDLMARGKPHLLVGMRNNLGGETRIDYAPSTRFSLEDRRSGRPWAERLPFPVHVVERVERIDHVARSRFLTRYVYHHGYFDGEEREFRGFGMVEQIDTDFFAGHVEAVGSAGGTQAVERDLFQAPVVTRTWFHSGSWKAGTSLLHPLASDYFGGRNEFADSEIPEGLSPRDLREFVRALKGLPLRQETYSPDGSPEQHLPYAVSETSYRGRRLQPSAPGRHGVFFPIARESISLAYERNPGDPRITHDFALEVDEYGDALKSATAVYGRRRSDGSLPAEVIADQQRTWVTYVETEYTADHSSGGVDHHYRLRAPFETRSFEISGVVPAGDRFDFEELASAIAGSAPIDYEEVANGADAQRRLLSRSRTLFLDNGLAPMPLGEWDTLGLPSRSLELAFTPGIVEFLEGEISDSLFAASGYLEIDGDWWIPSATAIYPADPAEHFYMPVGARDPFGLESVATYDEDDLLVERVAVPQAPWNIVATVNDYRVLGPVMTIDPNGNRSAVAYDALGVVTRSALMGKAGDGDGDTLDDPTARFEYELFNWMDHRRPVRVRSFAREAHGPANPRWHEGVAHLNGTGGVAVVKARVAPGKAMAVGADGSLVEVDADPRWVGNGRTVLNNKGRPVKQYEPYFSANDGFEDEALLREIGATPVIHYDPLGRAVRTDHPDGTFSRVEFDPWKTTSFDPNDSVLESGWYGARGSPDPAEPEPLADPQRRSAWLAARHAHTPTISHSDSLGRALYQQVDHGGGIVSGLRSQSDLTGRFARMFDQEGREVSFAFVGLAGIPILGESAERGARRVFHDINGSLVRSWDEHGRRIRIGFDPLRRAVSTFVRQGSGPERMISHVVHGDRVDGAADLNLLGAVHLSFDQGGMVRVPEMDFKGSPKSIERILASDYKGDIDWSALDGAADLDDLEAAAAPFLETEIFTATSRQDALGRPVEVVLPDGTLIVPAYDVGGRMSSLRVRVGGQGAFVEFLKSQSYDAKGQRLLAHYGNDLVSRCSYDPASFRLTDLVTERIVAVPGAEPLQALRFTYDAAGNLTDIADSAQQTHYFDNAVVKPEWRFEYDASYRLVRATGREHSGLVNDSLRTDSDLSQAPLPNANDLEAVRTYTETYSYDRLGNIRSLSHRFRPRPGVGDGWVRHYRYAFDTAPGDRTNRLSATSLPGDPDSGPFTGTYDHDVYGNMTRMPHLSAMEWNSLDQLRRTDLGGGGEGHYVYGSGGQRIRKVIERPGGIDLEWIYLGAVRLFRRRRRSDGDVRMERWTIHVSDETGRIAQVDTKTRDADGADPANPLGVPLIRYQYGNHQGSASLTTDQAGAPVSYEEYHPWGTTAYRSAKPGEDLSLKCYRFAGKEHDEETGLYYCGARYYAPWLGRWTSSDPAGMADGPNLYAYCGNDPVGFSDPSGLEKKENLRSVGKVTTGMSEAETLREFNSQYALSRNKIVTDIEPYGKDWRIVAERPLTEAELHGLVKELIPGGDSSAAPGGTATPDAGTQTGPPPAAPAGEKKGAGGTPSGTGGTPSGTGGPASGGGNQSGGGQGSGGQGGGGQGRGNNGSGTGNGGSGSGGGGGGSSEPKAWYEKLGAVIGGVFMGAIDIVGGFLNAALHPIETIQNIGSAIANGYEEDGILGAINAVNPAYHALVAGYESYQAYERGDYFGAGRQGFHSAFNVVATVGVAAGGAGLAVKALGMGEVAGTAAIASEAAAVTAPATEVVTISTTTSALQRLASVAESGQVRWIAGNEGLLNTFNQALGAAKSTKGGRAGFNLLRERLKRRMTVNGPIHHWKFPIRQFTNEAMAAENLYLTEGSAHGIIHGAVGRRAMGPGMAEPGFQAMFNFWLK